MLTAIAAGEPRARSDAEQIYRKAIDNGEVRAYNSLAVLVAERGELDLAEELFRKAIEAGDDLASRNLATLLSRRTDID